MVSKHIRDAVAGFVRQFDWDWWCSLSFKNPPSIDRADSAFRCWMNTLNRCTFGRNYHRRPNQGLRWLRGVEIQQREAIHFHVLVAGSPKLHCRTASQLWRKLAGDAVIRVYDNTLGAAEYLIKHYASTGNLTVGGVWNRDTSYLSGFVESCARDAG